MGVRLFSLRQPATPSAGPASSPKVRLQRGAEAAALLLLALSLYLGLALASVRVDPNDPSVVGANWVGPVGGAIASLLANGFGVVAWGLPLELCLFAAPLFRGRAVRFSGLRLSGDLLVAIVLAALAHVALPTASPFGGGRVGGNVGMLFGELLSALFSGLGSFLIGGTIVGLILIGRSDFSFIELCHLGVRVLKRGGEVFVSLLSRSRQAWAAGSRILQRERVAQEKEQTLPSSPRPTDAEILEELESAWRPMEVTGAPPLAVADSLRRQIREAPPWQQDDEAEGKLEEGTERRGQTPSQEEADPEIKPRPAKKKVPIDKAKSQKKDGAPKGEAAGSGAAASSTGDADGGKQLELRIVDTRPNAEKEPARKPLLGREKKKRGFKLPTSELLDAAGDEVPEIDREQVVRLASKLEETLTNYGVTGTVEEVHPGPTVTTYEVSPQAGTKVSKVAGLSDDLALGLSRKVRIIAPIPGKARIGFELPNEARVPVNLRELIEDQRFEKLSAKAPLPVVLGRDIVGAPCFTDLAAMPHVIVAGATGAGKSVGLNVMLSSLLFKRSPDELRMLMIDPKVVELAPFDGIPHMLLPVVTDMQQAAKALKWAVDEMERRYKAFAAAGSKNISTYNVWVDKVCKGELPPPEAVEVEAMAPDGGIVCVPAAKDGSDGVQLPGRLPHIVIVVDEFADLMMQQGKEVEVSVARLAQKARAAGMHVVLATQRPSVDVITGMIKANFPTRIAFRVAQKVDSRTILDEMGAELLLGRGDMLVKLNGSTDTHRVQCPFVSEEEVTRLTDALRAQGAPTYFDDILKADEDEDGQGDADSQLDPRYDEAVGIVAQTQRCSTSWLQRQMTIGYNRAAKIVESMEARGVVGPAQGAKNREVFVHSQ